MRIVVTGAEGFLGWHIRARLRATTRHDVVSVGRAQLPELANLSRGADALIHIAGVNRATPEEVTEGNVRLAEQAVAAVRGSGENLHVIFANSVQSGNETPYGTGKWKASTLLANATADVGGTYVDVRLPNLFGEHGRAHYNSFVATFAEATVNGDPLTVDDRPVVLLHAQSAAQVFIDALGAVGSNVVEPGGIQTTVHGVLDRLRHFADLYRLGEVPDIAESFDVDLFNTLRSFYFPAHYPIPLTEHSDSRGRLVECLRAHGGQGQTFISTTRPSMTRGEHFHLRKVERFVVLSGRARIELRRLFSSEVVHFDVTGEQPCVVDMPTLWVHNITNIGSDELVTLFWTNTLFDPSAPDTYPEPVRLCAVP